MITAGPPTFTQSTSGNVPITITMASGRPQSDIGFQLIPSAAAFGSLPTYIKNDGGIFTPAEITATGAGQSGAGTVGSVAGGFSWMIAAISDLGASQPCYISQLTANTSWHFLGQNSNVQVGFLISGGSDHPTNDGTPVISWSQTATPGHVWDTRLYRWSGGTGGPGLATNDRFSILGAGSNGFARALFGDRSTGARYDLRYDVAAGQFILRDEPNNQNVFTVGATVVGDFQFNGPRIGFFGAATAVKPTVAGAKGGNAALGSLLAALSTLGLVTDTTTA